MRTIPLALLAAALVAAPTPAPAQVAGPPAARQERPPHAPLERLLERRAELGLTDEQVTRLQAIQARLQEQNAPLREQVRAARPAHAPHPRRMTPEQRAEMRERMQAMTPEQRREMRGQMRARLQEHRGELEPVMRQLRENRRAAMDQVREVLTDEQEARLREMMEQRRERRPMGRGPRV